MTDQHVQSPEEDQAYREGYRYVVDAWVHPAGGGDDRPISIVYRERPSDDSIRARLRRAGSEVFDDFTPPRELRNPDEGETPVATPIIRTEEELRSMTMAQLVEHHNRLNPDLPARANTFSTKAKAVSRILALQERFGTVPATEPAEDECEPSEREEGAPPATEEAAEAPAVDLASVEAAVREAMDRLAAFRDLGPYKTAVAALIAHRIGDRPVTTDGVALAWNELTPEERAEVTPPPPEEPLPEPPRRQSVREVAEEMLLFKDPVTREGYAYDYILRFIHVSFPSARTTLNCLRWYASKLREKGHRVPDRPRATRPQTRAEGKA